MVLNCVEASHTARDPKSGAHRKPPIQSDGSPLGRASRLIRGECKPVTVSHGIADVTEEFKPWGFEYRANALRSLECNGVGGDHEHATSLDDRPHR